MNDPRNPQAAARSDRGDLSRRRFVALSVATGLAAATAPARAALAVRETEVSVKTADGTCDAALFQPTTGTAPAVLVWPDAAGLRPAMRDIGRRLAGEGYAVLVPNPFYRSPRRRSSNRRQRSTSRIRRCAPGSRR